MTGGRCAGCGKTDASCKVIKNHTMKCPEYLDLYRTNPAAALEPAEEMERWKMQDQQQEKDVAKAARREKNRTERREKSDKAAARWDKKGLLAPVGTTPEAPPESSQDESLLG